MASRASSARRRSSSSGLDRHRHSSSSGLDRHGSTTSSTAGAGGVYSSSSSRKLQSAIGVGGSSGRLRLLLPLPVPAKARSLCGAECFLLSRRALQSAAPRQKRSLLAACCAALWALVVVCPPPPTPPHPTPARPARPALARQPREWMTCMPRLAPLTLRIRLGRALCQRRPAGTSSYRRLSTCTGGGCRLKRSSSLSSSRKLPLHAPSPAHTVPVVGQSGLPLVGRLPLPQPAHTVPADGQSGLPLVRRALGAALSRRQKRRLLARCSCRALFGRPWHWIRPRARKHSRVSLYVRGGHASAVRREGVVTPYPPCPCVRSLLLSSGSTGGICMASIMRSLPSSDRVASRSSAECDCRAARSAACWRRVLGRSSVGPGPGCGGHASAARQESYGSSHPTHLARCCLRAALAAWRVWRPRSAC